MDKLKLAVAGGTGFLGRLAECMRKNAPEYVEVLSCQDIDDLPEFIIRIQPDILLYEQGAAIEEAAADTMKIQLSGDNSQSKPGNGEHMIFKYQQGPEILRQVFQVYGQSSKKRFTYWRKAGQLEMDVFYAPGGHELLLPFSAAYAAFCGGNGKVLYLSLSEFSGMALLFGDKEGENLSDLIYGIRQKKGRFQVCLQSSLHHAEKFDYVLPPLNPQDLYEIQEEDLLCMLTLLQEQTDYSRLVVSCGTLSRAAWLLMESGGKVFCVVKDSSFGKLRKEEFEKFLGKGDRIRLKEKVKYVSPQAGEFVNGVNILPQLQAGEFAQQVRKLAEE